jgi:hypothetical protein
MQQYLCSPKIHTDDTLVSALEKDRKQTKRAAVSVTLGWESIRSLSMITRPHPLARWPSSNAQRLSGLFVGRCLLWRGT